MAGGYPLPVFYNDNSWDFPCCVPDFARLEAELSDLGEATRLFAISHQPPCAEEMDSAASRGLKDLLEERQVRLSIHGGAWVLLLSGLLAQGRDREPGILSALAPDHVRAQFAGASGLLGMPPISPWEGNTICCSRKGSGDTIGHRLSISGYSPVPGQGGISLPAAS